MTTESDVFRVAADLRGQFNDDLASARARIAALEASLRKLIPLAESAVRMDIQGCGRTPHSDAESAAIAEAKALLGEG